eukprot:2519796-Pleurochrysis_carterae.AAC.1
MATTLPLVRESLKAREASVAQRETAAQAREATLAAREAEVAARERNIQFREQSLAAAVAQQRQADAAMSGKREGQSVAVSVTSRAPTALAEVPHSNASKQLLAKAVAAALLRANVWI